MLFSSFTVWCVWLRSQCCRCCYFLLWQLQVFVQHPSDAHLVLPFSCEAAAWHTSVVRTGCFDRLCVKLTAVEGHVLLTGWQALAKVSAPFLIAVSLFWAAPLIYFVWSWRACFSCDYLCLTAVFTQLFALISWKLIYCICHRHAAVGLLLYGRCITLHWMCFTYCINLLFMCF